MSGPFDSFQTRKEELLADLRQFITHKPDREGDLMTMMRQYLSAEPGNRESILRNLLRCANGESYPDPRAGTYHYTEADIQALGDVIDRYLEQLPDCGGDAAAIQSRVDDAVGEINTLYQKSNLYLIDTWRREELCAILNGAAELAGAASQEDMTCGQRMW